MTWVVRLDGIRKRVNFDHMNLENLKNPMTKAGISVHRKLKTFWKCQKKPFFEDIMKNDNLLGAYLNYTEKIRSMYNDIQLHRRKSVLKESLKVFKFKVFQKEIYEI